MSKPRLSPGKEVFFNTVLLAAALCGTILLIRTSQTRVGIATVLVMGMSVPMIALSVATSIPVIRQLLIERIKRSHKPRSRGSFKYPMITWSFGLLAIKEIDDAAYRGSQRATHIALLLPAILIGYAVLRGWWHLILKEMEEGEKE